MILLCTMLYFLNKINSYQNIYINKLTISSIFLILSLLEFYLFINLVSITFIFYRNIQFFIMVDVITTTSSVIYYYCFFTELEENQINERPVVLNSIIRNRNRNSNRNRNRNRNITRNSNNNITINRENLLIAEKEEFECNICYDINTKYYNIPCLNINHIVCENCSKNRLFNLNKCPWCNVPVTIVYSV